MDTLKAIQTYLDKMVTEVSGMKVLLLDAHTTPIVSLASTQSSLLSQEVYLTDRIDNPSRDRMPHLKCIMFLSPEPDTLEWVKDEISKPKYGEYWLYFSNVLTKSAIESLAQADEFEVIREVQEYFADYLTLLPSLFTLSLPPIIPSKTNALPSVPLYGENPAAFNTASLDLHIQGLVALLLSLKKRPLIRWERMSGMAKRLATEVQMALNNPPYAELFNFRATSGPAPLLLILDRRNDPVTPLLSQWTYQAMVHELVGITNNRVRVEGETRPELRELILSPSQDPFFASQLFSNFGDLGAALAAYVKDFQSKTASQSSIETVADMKRFVEEYPEFKKLGGNVSKHVALVGELSRIVERDGLLGISELEQSLASNESHATDLKSVLHFISTTTTPPMYKLRLAILYALRYQKFSANAIPHVVDTLISNGINADRARLVYVMLNYAGAEQRQDDLFMNENFFSRGKSALKGLKGVENVYTQHTPHLSQTLELLLRGRLKETSYPFLEGDEAGRIQRPQDIIVFMIGGTTYEEARAVALLNQQLAAGAVQGVQSSPGAAPKILLGGTCMQNSNSFLEMVSESAVNFPAHFYAPPPTLTYVAPQPSTSTAGGSNIPSVGIPNINLRVGNFEVGTGGVYRTNGTNTGVQLEGLQQGLTNGAMNFGNGAMNLFGKVRQGVERARTPQQQ